MTLTYERVSLALAPRPVKLYETIGSTNDAAKSWLLDGAAHGSVVIADEQTAGRGRLGRTWHTPPGVAIALSVILKLKPEYMNRINMVGTLAVLNTLQAIDGVNELEIKWANDVLVRGKKISGILPEAVWNGNTLAGVVLGIGLNVRNDFSGTTVKTIATTIERETGRSQDRTVLLAVLLFQLDQWLAHINADDIHDKYKAHMHMLGKSVSLGVGDKVVTGTAHDIDTNGALLLQQVDGHIVRVTAGDATVISRGD